MLEVDMSHLLVYSRSRALGGAEEDAARLRFVFLCLVQLPGHYVPLFEAAVVELMENRWEELMNYVVGGGGGITLLLWTFVRTGPSK